MQQNRASNIGIEAAIEKRNPYYDKVYSIVGIALILDPTMKKEFLSNALDWEAGWIESVTSHSICTVANQTFKKVQMISRP